MRFSLSIGAILAAILLGSVSAAPTKTEFKSKAAQGLRLLSLEDGAEPVWKTEDEKLDLIRTQTNFFDVTEVYEVDQARDAAAKKVASEPVLKATYPAPSHQTEVKALIAKLSTANMQSNLATLTAYNNRYYKATTGAQAAAWIQSTAKTYAAGRSDITITSFTHSWVQPSTIVRIAGATNPTGPVTIIGAHMDSINQSSPTSGRAPGADDDGTGTVNLLEILRVLVANGFKPSSPVEFQWYAGEEAGLLGSQAIASSYKSANKAVKAMLQLDMTGYFKPGTAEKVTFMTDYTDAGLTSFAQSLVTNYLNIGYQTGTCGYGCSDHASFYKYSYPSVMPFESKLGQDSPVIHTSSDTVSQTGFSWAHSLEFAKLGLAYIYEMAV
jgi:leucyl aminopeptidase